MMLENLFARAGQDQAFLCLTGCGFVLGALMHLTGYARRGRKILGALCDLMTAGVLMLMLMVILLRYGGGVRAYGLLGLLIGVLLYYAGVSRLVDALVLLWAKLLKRLRKKPRAEAGISSAGAEIITINDSPRKE